MPLALFFSPAQRSPRGDAERSIRHRHKNEIRNKYNTSTYVYLYIRLWIVNNVVFKLDTKNTWPHVTYIKSSRQNPCERLHSPIYKQLVTLQSVVANPLPPGLPATSADVTNERDVTSAPLPPPFSGGSVCIRASVVFYYEERRRGKQWHSDAVFVFYGIM